MQAGIDGKASASQEWVIQSVKKEIEELKQKQLKGRGGKAGEKRAEKIKKKTKRLENSLIAFLMNG